jgi:hypothetical protein
MSSRVLCGGCGVELTEAGDHPERETCSMCGSTARSLEADATETVKVYVSVAWKRKRPGKKKPVEEGFNGYEQSVATGNVVEKVSLFDREGNRRFERVVEVETGREIHVCDHPLTEHVGHGSAKRGRQK